MTMPTVEALRSYEAAGGIIREIRRELPARVRAGAPLLELAQYVEGRVVALGGTPAFPCNLSVNAVASHSTPHADDRRELRAGDLLKVDFGACVDGYIADAAVSFGVGTDEHVLLIAAAERALDSAIAMIRSGVKAGEIGRAIEASACGDGFNVLRGLYGHNLGRNCLHGGLTIPGYDDGSRKKIRDGDILAIEPFLTPGSGNILRTEGGDIFQLVRPGGLRLVEEDEKKLLSHIERKYNGFPFARRWLPEPGALGRLVRDAIVMEYPLLVEGDGAPVAQAEHTILVSQDGCRIIT